MSKILKVVGASWLQTKISSYVLGLLGVLAILALFAGQIERIQEDGNYAATVFYSKKTGYRIEYWGQSNELADIAKGVARAYFRGDVDTTGWSLLEVETDGSYPDEVQAYAAGIVEGALTWYLIHIHLENTIRAKCEDQPLEKQCNKLRDALHKTANIWKSYAEERKATDPFWHQVSLYYTQIAGMSTGWKHGIERSLNEYETDISDLYWLNSIAEVTEIQHKLNITIEDEIFNQLPGLSSAYIRIVNETSHNGATKKELYVAQNVAGSYSSMTRIMKRYKLNYHMTSKDTNPVPGTIVDFAGYPGAITSQDEFYHIRGEQLELAVTGTQIRNYNSKLWKSVNITEQIPIGPRVAAANHLATNTSSWSHTLARSNSGTACKQWLVLDYSRYKLMFNSIEEIVSSSKLEKKEVITESMVNNTKHTVVHRAGSGRAKGLLTVIEQVPGLTHSADISDAFLDNTYWATYGLPFFKDVAEVTQLSKMKEQYGDMFSETDSPRAQIFQREYKNASSLESIIQLMRTNNMTAINKSNSEGCDDACSLSGYWSVLGVRGDLLEEKGRAYGIINTMVLSGAFDDVSLNMVAVSGPPHSEITRSIANITLNKGNVASIYTDQFDDVPTINGLEIRDLVKHQQEEAEIESIKLLNKNTLKPFRWSESEFSDDAHIGLPDFWDFGPFKPNWSW